MQFEADLENESKTTERVVGLSDHTVKSNERNALFFGFRFRSCNPAGGWFAHNTNRIIRRQSQCRGLSSRPRPCRGMKEKCIGMNGKLPEITSQDIQSESPTQRIFSWRPRFEKSCWNIKDLANGKLSLNWEVPYKIIKLASKRAYHLVDLEGK